MSLSIAPQHASGVFQTDASKTKTQPASDPFHDLSLAAHKEVNDIFIQLSKPGQADEDTKEILAGMKKRGVEMKPVDAESLREHQRKLQTLSTEGLKHSLSLVNEIPQNQEQLMTYMKKMENSEKAIRHVQQESTALSNAFKEKLDLKTQEALEAAKGDLLQKKLQQMPLGANAYKIALKNTPPELRTSADKKVLEALEKSTPELKNPFQQKFFAEFWKPKAKL